MAVDKLPHPLILNTNPKAAARQWGIRTKWGDPGGQVLSTLTCGNLGNQAVGTAICPQPALSSPHPSRGVESFLQHNDAGDK